jgi:hypothetical protein
MKMKAQSRYGIGALVARHEKRYLWVKSNPFGALQHMPLFRRMGIHSITVCLWDETFGTWSHDALRYRTITDFFVAWKVVKAETHRMKVPLLRRTVGLGDGFAFFAERLPLWFKMKFNGCLDRRAYWNDLLQFVPRNARQAEVADVNRVLRSRGIDPHSMKEFPKCDVCMTWMATHVMGDTFIVCDKARCQDKVEAVLQEASHAH